VGICKIGIFKWEETTQYNVGLDFGLPHDRFSGSIDVYR